VRLFAFVVVAYSPLVVLKRWRKEAISERRQTSTPSIRDSVGLLHADHGSTLVIARQTFAKIGNMDAAAEAATGNREFLAPPRSTNWLQR